MEKTLKVAGLTPLTTIDFPGRLAAVVYCRGCSLRCCYCHNADLQPTEPSATDIEWSKVIEFLENRKRKLDGVVFTGGEPLLQGVLPDAIQQVKDMGFEIALHTAGVNPERLAKTLPLVDWVGFDAKTLFDEYETITGIPGSGEKAKRGMQILLDSGVAYEIRTTVDPDLISEEILIRMAEELAAMGVKTYRLQESTDSHRNYNSEIENHISKLFSDFDIRRAPLRKIEAT